MNPVAVTLQFPNAETARRFLAWMGDGGGELIFADFIEESSDPTPLTFRYDFDTLSARVSLAPEGEPPE